MTTKAWVSKADFCRLYDELFKKLDKEENEEGERDGKAGDDDPMPTFGGEDAPKAQVYEFYKVWAGFASSKPFGYADVYDPRDAPNRRIKRIIETDNKRERNKERNRFNDKVRELLEFVKSKDHRYKKYTEEDRRIREQKR